MNRGRNLYIDSGSWMAIDLPHITMPVARIVALRNVPSFIADHPTWTWDRDQWIVTWPSLNVRLSEQRLRTLMTRWTLIRMSQRRAKPGSGSQPLSDERKFSIATSWLSLLQSPPAPFAICGGVAVNYYARPRQTADLDMVVLAHDAALWDAFFHEHGWIKKGSLSIGGWTYTDGETEIDVLVSEASWRERAVSEAQHNLHDGLPIIPLVWLVWMKLDAGRTGDQTDISHMLATLPREEFRGIVTTLQPWLSPEDHEDLESLYELGRWELGNP